MFERSSSTCKQPGTAWNHCQREEEKRGDERREWGEEMRSGREREEEMRLEQVAGEKRDKELSNWMKQTKKRKRETRAAERKWKSQFREWARNVMYLVTELWSDTHTHTHTQSVLNIFIKLMLPTDDNCCQPQTHKYQSSFSVCVFVFVTTT